jgi:hypothetical protein
MRVTLSTLSVLGNAALLVHEFLLKPEFLVDFLWHINEPKTKGACRAKPTIVCTYVHCVQLVLEIRKFSSGTLTKNALV